MARSIGIAVVKGVQAIARSLRRWFSGLTGRPKALADWAVTNFTQTLNQLPWPFQKQIHEAFASDFSPMQARLWDPIEKAFYDAKYDPSLHAKPIYRIWQYFDDNLSDIANAPTAVYQTIFGNEYTPELESAVRLAANKLIELPKEAGFIGATHYSLVKHEFFGNQPIMNILTGVGANINAFTGQGFVQAFIKHSATPGNKGVPSNADPFTVLRLHFLGAALQHAFNPIHHQQFRQVRAKVNGQTVYDRHGNPVYTSEKVTSTQTGTVYDRLEALIKDPATDPRVKEAARYTRGLIDGSGWKENADTFDTMHANFLENVLLMNLGPIIESTVAHFRYAPGGLITNLKAFGGAIQSPIVSQTLDALGYPKSKEIHELLDELRFRNTPMYLSDYMYPLQGKFKNQPWFGIAPPLDKFVRRMTAAVTLLDETRKRGITVREILDGKTQAAREVRGIIAKNVQDIHGLVNPVTRIRATQDGKGRYLYVLRTARITQQNFTLSLINKAVMNRDFDAAVRLIRGVMVNAAFFGPRSILNPFIAGSLLVALSVMPVDVVNDFDPHGYMRTVLESAQAGSAIIPGMEEPVFPGVAGVIDRQLDTNFASKGTSLLDPEAYVPAGDVYRLSESVKRGMDILGKHKASGMDSLKDEEIDTLLTLGGNVGNLFSNRLTFGVPPSTIVRSIQAASHIDQGVREYDQKNYPVNPAGEIASIFVGGSGPGGHTSAEHARVGEQVFRGLKQEFDGYRRKALTDPNTQIPEQFINRLRAYLIVYGPSRDPHAINQEDMVLKTVDRLLRKSPEDVRTETMQLLGLYLRALEAGDPAAGKYLEQVDRVFQEHVNQYR